MILGKAELIRHLELGTIQAYRFDGQHDRRLRVDELHIGPNSIDVTLSPRVCFLDVAADGVCDPLRPDSLVSTSMTMPERGLVMPPRSIILGCTQERFTAGAIPFGDTYYDVVQEYVGRSTCGRMFLLSHVSAGFGDVGFSSAWTLELVNLAPYPIRLIPGMRIGQVVFRLVMHAGDVYRGTYAQQHYEPKPPVLGKDRFL